MSGNCQILRRFEINLLSVVVANCNYLFFENTLIVTRFRSHCSALPNNGAHFGAIRVIARSAYDKHFNRLFPLK